MARKHNINHAGDAYGDLYAEGSISGSPTYQSPAKGYGSATIRSVIPNPINFNTFTSSLVDLKAAAQATGGLYLNDTTKDGWRLTFNSDGTVTVATCKKATTGTTTITYYDIADRAPTCTTTSTPAVPDKRCDLRQPERDRVRRRQGAGDGGLQRRHHHRRRHQLRHAGGRRAGTDRQERHDDRRLRAQTSSRGRRQRSPRRVTGGPSPAPPPGATAR